MLDDVPAWLERIAPDPSLPTGVRSLRRPARCARRRPAYGSGGGATSGAVWEAFGAVAARCCGACLGLLRTARWARGRPGAEWGFELILYRGE
ncbi:hypothetical protein Q4I28_007061 [Leishmania naiffi]|uniref:Uncharacterized protein n=1 Tax=Leishmania naiffi TaxID=5678 RepID=A0AAW3BB98_9TRYP